MSFRRFSINKAQARLLFDVVFWVGVALAEISVALNLSLTTEYVRPLMWLGSIFMVCAIIGVWFGYLTDNHPGSYERVIAFGTLLLTIASIAGLFVPDLHTIAHWANAVGSGGFVGFGAIVWFPCEWRLRARLTE